MGKKLTFFWLLISFNSFALEVGDIILQPLRCWSCTLIERQENSDYSHMGIYLGDGLVAEAFFDKVKIVSFEKFDEKTDPSRSLLIRRSIKPIREKKEELTAAINMYLGLPYDRWFLWDDEKIYCSELVYKVLEHLIDFKDLSPKPMLFDQNPEYWDRYFRGQTPRGMLGISPGDFELSSDFVSVETL